MRLICHTFLLASLWFFWSCNNQSSNRDQPVQDGSSYKVSAKSENVTHEYQSINDSGTTIATRFNTPPDYQRVPVAKDSFGTFLRYLPLKPHGTKVRYFNGHIKSPENVYVAVVDYQIGTEDLQQCADAIIRLRGEFLFKHRRLDEIVFNFTSGDTARFLHYAGGYRPVVLNNNVTWVKKAGPDSSYGSFQNYLEMVYQYSGTFSLNRELKQVEQPNQMAIGDVFIVGGFPGHAVLVVDVAEHRQTGDKLFLLAQSYMPAQEIQILSNPASSRLSPWYTLDPSKSLITPEWAFDYSQLRRFRSY
jgi:hypothetical protein